MSSIVPGEDESKKNVAVSIPVSRTHCAQGHARLTRFIEPRQLEQVKLVSNDGEEFVVDYACAVQSETIRGLLESSPGARVRAGCMSHIVCV